MSPRIAFFLVRHRAGRRSPIMPAVIRLLSQRGAAVDLIYPDEGCTLPSSARVEHDLYVLKAKTPAALRLAESLHERGAATLNPYPVTALCRDKIETTRVLAAAGVPVPPTYVELDPRRLVPLLADGPLIVKPYRGSQGRGVRVVRSAEALEAATAVSAGDPVMAQRYLPPEGPDHKMYRIGGSYFCVRRPWPPRTYADKLGEPAEPDARLRELTLRCGTAIGSDLYGADVIISGGQPYVVDLSSFPGFKGVPDAAARLTDHIYAAATTGRAGAQAS
jgi:ribosomal protein S6--L-glutamate ligase